MNIPANLASPSKLVVSSTRSLTPRLQTALGRVAGVVVAAYDDVRDLPEVPRTRLRRLRDLPIDTLPKQASTPLRGFASQTLYFSNTWTSIEKSGGVGIERTRCYRVQSVPDDIEYHEGEDD